MTSERCDFIRNHYLTVTLFHPIQKDVYDTTSTPNSVYRNKMGKNKLGVK